MFETVGILVFLVSLLVGVVSFVLLFLVREKQFNICWLAVCRPKQHNFLINLTGSHLISESNYFLLQVEINLWYNFLSHFTGWVFSDKLHLRQGYNNYWCLISPPLWLQAPLTYLLWDFTWRKLHIYYFPTPKSKSTSLSLKSYVLIFKYFQQ